MSANAKSFQNPGVPVTTKTRHRPRAVVRKSVAEYRRTVESRDIDVERPELWEPAKESTHNELVRRETWWVGPLPIYSREIIVDSQL